MAPRKSVKFAKCGTVVINGRKRNLYKGDQGGVYHKDGAGKKTYIDKAVSRPKKCGPGAKRSRSASPRRKSRSPRRKSPNTHRGHLHVPKTSLKNNGNPSIHKHPTSKSPKPKSPNPKSPNTTPPLQPTAPSGRPGPGASS